MTETLFDPTQVERITCLPGPTPDIDAIPSEPLVRAYDYDKLLSLYRELQSKHEPKG